MLPELGPDGLLDTPRCGFCDEPILQNNHWQSMEHPYGAWIHMADTFRPGSLARDLHVGSGLMGEPDETAIGPHKAYPRDNRTNEQVAASDELRTYKNAKYDAEEEVKDTADVSVEPKLGNLEPHMFGNPNLGGQFK
jgi:hypothetical protein